MPSVQSVVTVKTSFARDTTWCKGQTGSRDRRPPQKKTLFSLQVVTMASSLMPLTVNEILKEVKVFESQNGENSWKMLSKNYLQFQWRPLKSQLAQTKLDIDVQNRK